MSRTHWAYRLFLLFSFYFILLPRKETHFFAKPMLLELKCTFLNISILFYEFQLCEIYKYKIALECVTLCKNIYLKVDVDFLLNLCKCWFFHEYLWRSICKNFKSTVFVPSVFSCVYYMLIDFCHCHIYWIYHWKSKRYIAILKTKL